jgi:2-polyprenyl-3-methyl-5-hydroxy-6-metoxy-1,4-benzoquinol methylase
VTSVELIKTFYNIAVARKKILEDKLGKSLALNFQHQSILDFKCESKFDLIWMEETFHHLEPRDVIIKIICSLLKPHGYVVISETNAFNLYFQFKLFRIRGFKTIVYLKENSEDITEDNTGVVWGHERILPPYKLARLFSKAGIKMESITYFRLLPNKFIDNNFTKWIDNAYEKYIPILIKRFLSAHYNYVGKKINTN